jgi:hypothetical protein
MELKLWPIIAELHQHVIYSGTRELLVDFDPGSGVDPIRPSFV